MIQINDPNLDQIRTAYNYELKKKFHKRINAIYEVIALLRSSKNIDTNTVKNNVKLFASALLVVSQIKKLLDSKSKEKKGKETADLIYSLNKLKIKSDKRSKCRKTILYKDVEITVKKIEKFINKKKLFESDPDNLICLNNLLNKYVGKLDEKLYNYFFDYTKYYDIINNNIGKQLNLKCCPYCNRNYITYIPNNIKRHIGPSYDHFFNKDKYKFLTLSFYNLIPSCYICNSNLKSSKDFQLKTHIHPFKEGFDSDCIFDFELMTKNYLGNKEISFKPKLVFNNFTPIEKKIKLEGNLSIFKLNQIYETHEDSVEEIYRRFDKGSPFYIESISEILQKLNTSEEEFYRYYFRNYFNSKDFNKRPLAKLDRDIYDKFKMIS